MPNINAAFGLLPVHADGRPWEGALNPYYVPAADNTALYKGDPVTMTSAGANGLPGITRASAGQRIVGVFMGLAQPNLVAHGKIYREASVAATVLVCDDADACFIAQEDSGGAALAAYHVGLNIDVSVGAGSTVTGRSGTLLDSSTTTSAAAGTFRLIRKAEQPGNDIGNYAKWIVKPNLHQRAPGSAVAF